MKLYASIIKEDNQNRYYNHSDDVMVVLNITNPFIMDFYEKEDITQEVFNQCAEYRYAPIILPCIVGFLSKTNQLTLGTNEEFEEKKIKPTFFYIKNKRVNSLFKAQKGSLSFMHFE